MEKPGRHRFVRLQDLVEHQQRMKVQTREALDHLVEDAVENDLYAKTNGPPPRTRRGMAFLAFLDANVLCGATLNDTLLRIAEQGAFRPHWSKNMSDELTQVLVREAEISQRER